MSLTIILDIAPNPPPPIPQTALAMEKCTILLEKILRKHPNPKKNCANINAYFLPTISETLPYKGWKAVFVNK